MTTLVEALTKLTDLTKTQEPMTSFITREVNLYLDVLPSGSIKLNFPDRSVEDMKDSCVLDVADAASLEQEGLKLTIAVKRDAVCTRRVVGTETVTLPAVEAQAERTEEREVIEWDCEPLLSKASA